MTTFKKKPSSFWEHIRARYESGGPRNTQSALAREFGVSHTAIRKHRLQEGWVDPIRDEVKHTADAMLNGLCGYTPDLHDTETVGVGDLNILGLTEQDVESVASATSTDPALTDPTLTQAERDRQGVIQREAKKRALIKLRHRKEWRIPLQLFHKAKEDFDGGNLTDALKRMDGAKRAAETLALIQSNEGRLWDLNRASDDFVQDMTVAARDLLKDSGFTLSIENQNDNETGEGEGEVEGEAEDDTDA